MGKLVEDFGWVFVCVWGGCVCVGNGCVCVCFSVSVSLGSTGVGGMGNPRYLHRPTSNTC